MLKIKPGIMVACSTRLRGGVEYRRRDLDRAQLGATEKIRWETERTIVDAEEYERATRVRALARNRIAGACWQTAFGLICPQDREGDLDAAVSEARSAAQAFNGTAQHSEISVYVLKGRIAQTDEEATTAIQAESADLLDQLERAIKAADPAAIRDVCTRSRQINELAEGEAAEAVAAAIKEARAVARAIVKRVEKAGEEASTVLAEVGADGLAAINTARFAMLLPDAPPTAEAAPEEQLTAVDTSRFTGLEVL